MAPTLRFCTACGTPAEAAGSADSGVAIEGPALAPAVTPAATAGSVAPAAAPPAEEVGERRHATVMFSDLSGYTALNERMDPEEVSRLMTRVRAVAVRVVEAHGGMINQVVGDEIMALFGIPHAGRDDPLRAVRAALALNAEMATLAAEVAADGGPALALHTGIHSGLVVVRPCDPHQGKLSLTGDTVNTAARLLGLAAGGELVVGETTWRAVMPHVVAEPLPATPVRGKRKPLPAWRIEREVGEAPALPMVGRDDEWQQAVSALGASVERRQARLVVIRGEAGIGKSRLLRSLADEARRRGMHVARGQVPDFGPSRGGAAWRQVALALLDDTGPAAAAAAIDCAVDEGALDPALRPHLCALVDIPLPAEACEAYAQLDAAARERGTIDALAAIVRQRAGTRGLMIAVEDTHWAEPPALALLARLAAACRHHPLLAAVTTRPESSDLDLARRTHARDLSAVTIDLAPLGDSAALAIAGRFEMAMPDVVARCIERAGGNPLFLEQLLLSATEALRDALPGSIQALVLARLDRLAPPDKVALQAASVLGQHFDAGALRWLIDSPAYAFSPLVEAGLLRESGEAAEFAHALIRDGAYESLLKSRRRELHLRAATWFESRDAGLRAEHLERAGSPLAPRAYLAACEAELARFRFEPALALGRRGAALEADRDVRHRLFMRMGETLRELGRNQEALQAYERARELAGDDPEMLAAWLETAMAQRNVSDLAGAFAALAAAQPIAERLDDVRRRVQIHYLRGNVAFARGLGELCLDEHTRAFELARGAGDVLGQAQALSGLGDAMYLAGRMQSALRYFTQCLELARQVGAMRFAVMNRAMVGWCMYWCGHAEDALQEERAAGADARALGHRNAQVMTEESLGLMLRWMGRWDEAAEVNRGALALAREVGARRYEMIVLVSLSADARRNGAHDRARALAAEAWQMARDVGAVAFMGPLAVLEMARNTDDTAERERLFAEAEAMLAGSVASHCHIWMHADMMAVRLGEGRYDEVLRHADRLERFVVSEPFVWATHPIAAARALVRCHRDGERSDTLRDEVGALLQEARRIGMSESAQRLELALAAL